MKKNGFTLVELMIVVIVIGILAAVAMPKFQSAADKAKVAEAPMILSAIAGGQESYRIVHGQYLDLGSVASDWEKLGLKFPEIKYFDYTVEQFPGENFVSTDPLAFNPLPPEFTATATLRINLSRAKIGDVITIEQNGNKRATRALNMLIPSFGATPIDN